MNGGDFPMLGKAVAEALGLARESQLPAEYGSVSQRAFWKGK